MNSKIPSSRSIRSSGLTFWMDNINLHSNNSEISNSSLDDTNSEEEKSAKFVDLSANGANSIVDHASHANVISKISQSRAFDYNSDLSSHQNAINQQVELMKELIAFGIEHIKKSKENNIKIFQDQNIKSVKSTRDYMAEQSNGYLFDIDDYVPNGDGDGEFDETKAIMNIK